MDLTDLGQLKCLLKGRGLMTTKSLGQNFLVNRKSLDKIVTAASLNADDTVLEIGPGPGVLTLELLSQAKKVIAVELDRAFVPVLEEITSDFDNLEIRHEDALKFLPEFENYKLVANIPYYLTSKLLRHFLEEVKHKPSLMVLLMQKEVAEKILSEKSNLLSLSVQVFASAEIVASVPAKHFYPQPKVDSVIFRLKLYEKPAIKSDLKTFFKLTRTAFLGKRKQLKNTLSNLGIPSEKVQKVLLELKFSEKARPEELSLENWDELVFRLGS